MNIVAGNNVYKKASSHLSVFDWLALVFSLAVTAFSFWYAYGEKDGTPMVYVQDENSAWVYPLHEDRSFSIPGPLGETHIIVRESNVYIEDSPCRDKLCVSMGSVSLHGRWIACLPNRVFLRIDSVQAEGDVDAASY